MIRVVIQLGLDRVNSGLNAIVYANAELMRSKDCMEEIFWDNAKGAKGSQTDKGFTDDHRANTTILLLNGQESGAQE